MRLRDFAFVADLKWKKRKVRPRNRTCHLRLRGPTLCPLRQRRRRLPRRPPWGPMPLRVAVVTCVRTSSNEPAFRRSPKSSITFERLRRFSRFFFVRFRRRVARRTAASFARPCPAGDAFDDGPPASIGLFAASPDGWSRADVPGVRTALPIGTKFFDLVADASPRPTAEFRRSPSTATGPPTVPNVAPESSNFRLFPSVFRTPLFARRAPIDADRADASVASGRVRRTSFRPVSRHDFSNRRRKTPFLPVFRFSFPRRPAPARCTASRLAPCRAPTPGVRRREPCVVRGADFLRGAKNRFSPTLGAPPKSPFPRTLSGRRFSSLPPSAESDGEDRVRIGPRLAILPLGSRRVPDILLVTRIQATVTVAHRELCWRPAGRRSPPASAHARSRPDVQPTTTSSRLIGSSSHGRCFLLLLPPQLPERFERIGVKLATASILLPSSISRDL
jgi:hypothetical protein